MRSSLDTNFQVPLQYWELGLARDQWAWCYAVHVFEFDTVSQQSITRFEHATSDGRKVEVERHFV